MLRTIISFGFLGILLYKVNGKEVLNRALNLRLEFLLLLIIADILGFIVRSWRWQILLRIWKIDISLAKLFFYFQGARMLNFILPSSIGGDVYRFYLIVKNSSKKAGTVVGTLIDRLAGMSVGFLLAGGGTIWLLAHHIDVPNNHIIFAFIIGWFIAMGILFSKTLEDFFNRRANVNIIFSKLNRIFQSMTVAKEHPSAVVKALFISILIKLQEILVPYFVAKALSLPAPLLFCIAFVPIISFVTIIPVSISGIGIRESMFIVFFSKIGFSTTDAFTLSITVFSWMAVMGAIGGITYIIWWLIQSHAQQRQAK